MSESSFDIVSKLDRQELSNALDIARREIDTRFDFKGSGAKINLEKDGLHLEASDEMKMRQLIDVVQSKVHKRGLSIKAFRFNDFESNVTGIVKCKADIQNGLSQDQAKKVGKLIKDSKLKVQFQIQGDQIRVSSKSKDELQSVQKLVRDADFDFDASFTNYR